MPFECLDDAARQLEHLAVDDAEGSVFGELPELDGSFAPGCIVTMTRVTVRSSRSPADDARLSLSNL